MANWERKSSYLLREIVKFRTYIDSLAAAQAQKDKIYAGREANDGKGVDGTDDVERASAGKDVDGASAAPKASQTMTA